MAELFELQEVRIRYPGTTYSDSFTAANNAAWNVGTATRLNHVENRVSLDGLKQSRLPNTSVVTRRREQPPGVLGKRGGSVSVSFYLGSNDGTGQDAIKTLLSKIYGGLSTPSQDVVTLDGTSTTGQLDASGIEGMCAPGSAVLVVPTATSRGAVHVVAAEDTDYLVPAMALNSAPNSGTDKAYLSHTVYPDSTAAVQVFELLLIGADDSPDQINMIGCAATSVSFGNLNINEGDGQLPIVTVEFTCGDFRYEPAGTKATMTTTTAASGPDPVMDRGLGGFYISDRDDFNNVSYGYLEGGNPTLDPGINFIPIRSPQGANGIGGWVRGKGSVQWGFTALLGEGAETGSGEVIPDLTDDHAADSGRTPVAKQIVMQFGHEPGACVAFSLNKAYINELPTETDLDGLLAAGLAGHGDEDASVAEGALLACDHAIHFFHE